MESAKGRNHARDVLIGLAAVWFVYQIAFESRSASDSSRPVWQSDDDLSETLTDEAEGFETLANADVGVDEGECLETKMFEMWNKEAEAEKDLLRADAAEVHKDEPEHSAGIEHRLEELAANASARHAAHLEHAAHLRREARMHMAKEAREARALKALHTKWDEQAEDKMADLKRQLCADPARKEYPMCKEAPETRAGDAADVARHQAEFASEMREIQARHDQWDHTAKDQWRELRHRLCADPSRHGLHVCQHVHGPTSEETHAELDHRMHQLHDQHEAWDHRAHDEIASLKTELCADPARRGYAACAGEHARIDDHAHALHAKHHEWDEHARDEIHVLMDELCADPARKDYAACTKQAADVQREPQWSDVQARLQSQYDSAIAAQQRAASARQAEFDRLEGDTKATLNGEPELTGWAQELIGSQVRMRERLEQLHAGHRATASESRGFMAKEGDQTASWAKGLMDMQAKMQYQLEHLHDHHHHHHHAEGAAAPQAPVSSSWAQGLLNMQAEMQNQLDHLHDHHQRHGHSATRDTSSEPSAWVQNLMDRQAKMQFQLDHLHDHTHSHHHHVGAPPAMAVGKSSSKLRGAQRVASPAVQSGGSPPAAAALEWRTATSWKELVPDYGSKAAVLDREWLHSTEWKGEAPNVTCIMALPATETQHLHLMYAVNNFKLVAQRYKGASELVVVYHHNDEEGAKLVRKCTEEGGDVRGVASRDDAASFPTTMAFRYAAWTAKSHVIAQWDFETYYHPDRLNMQVRALASADRPASFVLSADGPRGAKGARGLESTLAGEAGWMRQHWHPRQSEESGVLELAQAHNIVLVDSPALLYGANMTPSHDNRESKLTQS